MKNTSRSGSFNIGYASIKSEMMIMSKTGLRISINASMIKNGLTVEVGMGKSEEGTTSKAVVQSDLTNLPEKSRKQSYVSDRKDCWNLVAMELEFDMTDLGALNHFLGISVTRDTTGMFLSQKRYAIELLERAHILNCNPPWTLVDTESKLGPEGTPISDPTLYQSLAVGLQYLTFTRPDLSFSVQQICLYMHDPREPHLAALKRILCYIRGTLEFVLQLYASSESSLVAYSDADWAGCPTTHRSTSGYCIFLGHNNLSWSFKRQPTLSRSSAESEYRSVANVVAETTWLRNLLRELHTPLLTATLVYCDNVSAVYLSANPVQHQRTKHIEIDIHFVRDMVAIGHVRVLRVPSCYQYADIFTKGLPSALFE
ncbi:ribonuclease H-like domain-containing protein [Tanacetum coccineum]|uniref:Ribonuclease H-like domain-containing protein n=1 Tax=Tanacetum coccineum TaxID=301880 RepID=A0ABQ4YUH2_9ASTR